MAETIAYKKAMLLMERAYRAQMHGELSDAIELYEKSLDVHPTAEAYTYLGWSFAMLGRYDDAIEKCEQAIVIDPQFGNPYNDIGSYLLALDQHEEAIPWLESALDADRYESPQFPLMNLGRAYVALGKYRTALEFFDAAVEIAPTDMSARALKYQLLGQLN